MWRIWRSELREQLLLQSRLPRRPCAVQPGQQQPSKMTSMAFVMVNNLPEWPNKCQSLAQAHRRANF